jgi:hypothetical protein
MVLNNEINVCETFNFKLWTSVTGLIKIALTKIYLSIKYTPQATTGLVPISYRRALLSTLLHVTVYIFTQFSESVCTGCK